MKNNKKIKIILILILSILFLTFLKFKPSLNKKQNNDFLFLKLFHIQNKENEEKYEFKVNYNNMNFKTVNLSDTVNKQFNKKIEPGTNGKFNIILNSNKNLFYQVEFKSKNEKPRNLNFMSLVNGQNLSKADTLEELSNSLNGTIEKNTKVNITILWYWPYEKENQQNTDAQDTHDGKNIEKYQFDIFVFGKEK